MNVNTQNSTGDASRNSSFIFPGHHRLNLVNPLKPVHSKPSKGLINAQWVLNKEKAQRPSKMLMFNCMCIKTHHLVPFLILLSCYVFCHLKTFLRVKPGQRYPADKVCVSSPELSENWGSSQLAECSFSKTWIGGGDRHRSMTGGSTSAEQGIGQTGHDCSLTTITSLWEMKVFQGDPCTSQFIRLLKQWIPNVHR